MPFFRAVGKKIPGCPFSGGENPRVSLIRALVGGGGGGDPRVPFLHALGEKSQGAPSPNASLIFCVTVTTMDMTRSVRYQPILHTLYYTLHTEHAYLLSYHI